MDEVISDNSLKANKELHANSKSFGSRSDAGGILWRLPAAVQKLDKDYNF